MKSNKILNSADSGVNEAGSADVQGQIRSHAEVMRSRNAVRSYSADGQLYAYREGDTHVVVSRGRELRTQWMKRVSAERTAVENDGEV